MMHPFDILIPTSPRQRREWEARVRAARFLGYQSRWINDKSRMSMMEKCRQAGVSWCDAFDSLMETAQVDWPFDCWISSRDQIQAQLYGQDVLDWARRVNVAAGTLGESVIEVDGGKQISALRLPLSNGRNIWSLSSNVDAQAGKRGTRKNDEFALNANNRQLYAIGKPGIQWGGRLRMFSTHRGTANFFNQLILEIREKGNPKKISLHRVTIVDAINDGLLIKLKEQWAKLDPEDPRLVMTEDEWLQSQRDECPDEETWQQEYMCVPSDDATAFLSYELIDGCKYKPGDAWEKTLSQMAASANPLYLGGDIARVRDLTVFWVVEKVGGLRPTVHVVALQNVPFDEQEHRLYQLLELPALRRACIDNSGIGRQLVERAQKRFGEYKVEAITFTPAVKEELAYPLRAGFEDRSVRIPDDRAIIAHHRAVRKETTAAGNVRFVAEANEDGHADYFWAHALALHAGKDVGSMMGAQVPMRPHSRAGRGMSARDVGVMV